MASEMLRNACWQTWCCLLLSVAGEFASTHLAFAEEKLPVDFGRQIIPLLTKAGCNSGACHGAAAGRGHLQLSLFGSQPIKDYETLAHTLNGRFVDRQFPAESLLLQKPTENLQHGGGMRLDQSSSDYEQLLSWIRLGLPRGAMLRLTDLELKFSESELQVDEVTNIQVFGRWSNGQTTDVTSSALIEGPFEKAETAGALRLSRSDTQIAIRALQPGLWNVSVRVGPVAEVLQIWCRPKSNDLNVVDGKHSDGIDELIQLANARVGLSVANRCEPHLLARRLYLDLAGAHPTNSQWRSAIEQIKSGKTDELVDSLLASEQFPERASLQIANWIPDSRGSARVTKAISQELNAELRRDDNLRTLTRELLIEGVASRNRAGGLFLSLANDPRTRAELVTSMFMGVRINCAQCHDHPFDHWTQDDYFAIAACWAELDASGQRVSGRTTTNLKSGREAVPHLPDRAKLSGTKPPDVEFVNWLCADDNLYLARNFANRIWAWLMGTGLVAELDDLRGTNPASNPQLLDAVANRLQLHGFRLKPVVREIVLSEAYARSCKSDVRAQQSEATLMLNRKLCGLRSPREIDAIAFSKLVRDALESRETTGESDGLSSAASSMMAEQQQNSCTRGANCQDPFTEALDLVAGLEINRWIQNENRPLDQLANGATVSDVLSSSYLAIFGIAPVTTEVQKWQDMMQAAQVSDNLPINSETVDSKQLAVRNSFVTDLLWSWLVSDSFRRSH